MSAPKADPVPKAQTSAKTSSRSSSRAPSDTKSQNPTKAPARASGHAGAPKAEHSKVQGADAASTEQENAASKAPAKAKVRKAAKARTSGAAGVAVDASSKAQEAAKSDARPPKVEAPKHKADQDEKMQADGTAPVKASVQENAPKVIDSEKQKPLTADEKLPLAPMAVDAKLPPAEAPNPEATDAKAREADVVTVKPPPAEAPGQEAVDSQTQDAVTVAGKPPPAEAENLEAGEAGTATVKPLPAEAPDPEAADSRMQDAVTANVKLPPAESPKPEAADFMEPLPRPPFEAPDQKEAEAPGSQLQTSQGCLGEASSAADAASVGNASKLENPQLAPWRSPARTSDEHDEEYFQPLTHDMMLRQLFEGELERQGRGSRLDRWELTRFCGSEREVANLFGMPKELPLTPYEGTRDVLGQIFMCVGTPQSSEISWEEVRAFYYGCCGRMIASGHVDQRAIDAGRKMLEQAFANCDDSGTGRAGRAELMKVFGSIAEVADLFHVSMDVPCTPLNSMRDAFEQLFYQPGKRVSRTVSWEELLDVHLLTTLGKAFAGSVQSIAGDQEETSKKVAQLAPVGQRPWQLITRNFLENMLAPALMEMEADPAERQAPPSSHTSCENGHAGQHRSQQQRRAGEEADKEDEKATVRADRLRDVSSIEAGFGGVAPASCGCATSDMQRRRAERAEQHAMTMEVLTRKDRMLSRYTDLVCDAFRAIEGVKSGLFEACREVDKDDVQQNRLVVQDAQLMIGKIIDRLMLEAAELQEQAEQHARARPFIVAELWHNGASFSSQLRSRISTAQALIDEHGPTCKVLTSAVQKTEDELQGLQAQVAQRELARAGKALKLEDAQNLLSAFSAVLLPHCEDILAQQPRTAEEAVAQRFLATVRGEAAAANIGGDPTVHLADEDDDWGTLSDDG